MSHSDMKWDDDGWPLTWPDYTKRIPACDKCKHPTSYHGMHVTNGKVGYVCNICGCTRTHNA